ncbi:aldo/keto reductase [Crateriforma conspicua]|uniref:aldo/keto reductase n=1 Tax=Crateriforma conspicua TaxID=2527996 RepID=UPI00118A550D|nr:aldo/keto reductase [Crateriforma conspicua]QDV60910.1 General stress protein 69 [Crateriforma conspicua]
MKTRPFGQTGWDVSEIGFGSWALGGQWGPQTDDQSTKTLRLAIDRGINFIDTAAGYGDGRSEKVIAKTLNAVADVSPVRLATKAPPAEGPWPPSPYCRWQDRYGAAYLRENIQQRLRNLGTDCLDVLQLHTWTRAWNDDPQPLLVLRQLCDEGLIRYVGVSTPEQDQNCVVQLMRDGLVDVVQVIFNLFDQEAAAQIFPVAEETGTAVIVRVALDEGSLTGKYDRDHQFGSDDFRQAYFAGDRLERTVDRVAMIRQDIRDFGLQDDYSLTDVAIKFALSHAAVSTVIVGMRSPEHVKANAAVSDKADLPAEFLQQLRRHNWRRGVWYAGK